MLTEKRLRDEYKRKKPEILKRLKNFSEIKDEKKKFLELCYCLCTPQSKAERVAEVIHEQNIDKLIGCSSDELSGMLKTNVRFHNKKAGYIIGARRFIPNISMLPDDTNVAREFLVKKIKGLGYKEASHFLRNIGYRNICIIDSHVISLMHEIKVFKRRDSPKNTEQYLNMEQKIMDYAKKIKIDVDELDLLLWSIETGFFCSDEADITKRIYL